MSPKAQLQPNITDAETFLDHLDYVTTKFTFQTFDDNQDRRDPSLTRVLHGSLWVHWDELGRLNRRGAGIFICVNTTDLKGRANTNITKVRAIWQEDDSGDAPELPIRPHIVVESSPGKYHRYFRIRAEKCPSPTEFRTVQKRLAKDYGSDPNAIDIARVLRVPGFFHQKINKKKGQMGKPFMVRLVETNEHDRFSWQKIIEIFPPIKHRDKQEYNEDKPTPQTILDLQSALNYLEESADDRITWIKFGHALKALGSIGRTLWMEWSAVSDKFDQYDAERTWKSFKPTGIGYKAIFAEAQVKGWVNPGSLCSGIDLRSEFSVVGTEDYPEAANVDDIKENTTLPPELLKPPGLVGQIADYSNAAAHRDQPLMGVLAGLITVSSLIENHIVVSPWRTTLNLYVILIAETGEGKEAPRRAVKACLNSIHRLDRVKEAVSSGPALLRALSDSNRITLLFDEFGRLLRVASNPTCGHLYELMTEITKFYGLADSSHGGKAYAKKSDNVPPIDRPYVVVFATTTERTLTDALSHGDVVDGTLNRYLVVKTDNRQPDYQDPDSTMSDELLEVLKHVDSMFEFSDDRSKATIMLVTKEAKKALIEFRTEADDKRVAELILGPLWARAFENAIKVAGILAFGLAAKKKSSVKDLALNIECANWGITFTRWCIEGMVDLAADQVADSDVERVQNQMRGYIEDITANPKKHGAGRDKQFLSLNTSGYVTLTQITKRFQKVSAFIRKEALSTLIESGDIQLKQEVNGGQNLYRLVQHG